MRWPVLVLFAGCATAPKLPERATGPALAENQLYVCRLHDGDRLQCVTLEAFMAAEWEPRK